MILDRLFIDHPHSVGETYFEHQRRALSFAGRLIGAGLGCALHALVPGVCVRSASDAVLRLHGEMTPRRAAAPPLAGEVAD
jgi:hypothetical protein